MWKSSVLTQLCCHTWKSSCVIDKWWLFVIVWQSTCCFLLCPPLQILTARNSIKATLLHYNCTMSRFVWFPEVYTDEVAVNHIWPCFTLTVSDKIMDIAQSDNKSRPKKNPSTYLLYIHYWILKRQHCNFLKAIAHVELSLRLSSALPLVGKASTLISVRGVAWSLSQPDMPYLALAGTHVLHHFNWHSNNLVVVNFKFPFLLLSFQQRFYWMSQVWAIERPR